MVNSVIAHDLERLQNRSSLDLDYLRNKTVLVTGGNSMLGRNLSWLICDLNDKQAFNTTLYVLVRNLKKAESIFKEYTEKPYFHLLHQDVCEPIIADSINESLDLIFHFAGSASARFIIEDPVGIIRANTIGTANVLDLARKTGAQVVFASTREVYGRLFEEKDSLAEEDVGLINHLLPRSSYPESKKLAEALFIAYAKQFSVPFTILRIAHVYGPGMEIEKDGRIMSELIGSVVRKENIVLTSNGLASRGFCYISDCLDGILRAAFAKGSEKVFNLANENEAHTIRDTAQILISLFPDLGIKLVYANEEDSVFKGGYNPDPFVKLDTRKIESLGWKPEVTLSEGMKRTVLSFW